MKKTLMAFAAVAVLAACTNSVGDGMPAPQLTFANFAPVTLNVQSSAVQEAYINPNDPQDISGQFVLSPAEAVKRYAARRYQAGNAPDGQFTIVIEDARVHMRQIDQKNKVLEWSGVGKEDEYRVFLQLKVVSTPSGMQGRSSTTIRSERTLVMPSSVTLAEREMRQIKFLETLMADIDQKIGAALDETPSIRQ